MHDLSSLTPDQLPGVRAACETLISFREALDPRFYDKVCTLYAGIEARQRRCELEDTAKVTRIRKHITGQAADFRLHGATAPALPLALPGCCGALARYVEWLFGQLNEHIHLLGTTMNDTERRTGERHDELVCRIDHVADLIVSGMGS